MSSTNPLISQALDEANSGDNQLFSSLFLPTQRWLYLSIKVRSSAQWPKDPLNKDLARLMTKDMSSWPTGSKHGRAPATQATRGSNIESASHGGQDYDTESSNRDQWSVVSSPKLPTRIKWA